MLASPAELAAIRKQTHRALDTAAAVPERCAHEHRALSSKARAALDAICDTFAPGGDGLPSATSSACRRRCSRRVANPRAVERKQSAGCSAWGSACCGDRRRRGRASPPCRRRSASSVLLAWADSRVRERRAAFQALRKGTLLAYYGKGGDNGDRNPVWTRSATRDRSARPQDPPPPTIEPLEVDRATLGSSATSSWSVGRRRRHRGGRARAGRPRRSHRRGGRYFSEEDFDGAELSGFIAST